MGIGGDVRDSSKGLVVGTACGRVSGLASPEPSYTRLMTHETWSYYTGRPPLARWWTTILNWRHSTVFANVWPVALIASVTSTLFLWLVPAHFLPGLNPFPMSLQGTAIGLLLVFRTNNSYQRLSEAREQWSRAIVLCRNLAQGVVIAARQGGYGMKGAPVDTCRYLVAFGWELCMRLSQQRSDDSNELLLALLPPAEAEYICAQRSRPVALLGEVRQLLYRELADGRILPPLYCDTSSDSNHATSVWRSSAHKILMRRLTPLGPRACQTSLKRICASLIWWLDLASASSLLRCRPR